MEKGSREVSGRQGERVSISQKPQNERAEKQKVVNG